MLQSCAQAHRRPPRQRVHVSSSSPSSPSLWKAIRASKPCAFAATLSHSSECAQRRSAARDAHPWHLESDKEIVVPTIARGGLDPSATLPENSGPPKRVPSVA